MFYLGGLVPHLNSLFTVDRQLEKTTFLKALFHSLFVTASLHLGGPRWLPKKKKNVSKICVFTLEGLRNSVDIVLERLLLQSSELGLPHPLTRRRVCLPPFGSGGRGGAQRTRLRERGGGGGGPNTDEGGQTQWYSRYICTLSLLVRGFSLTLYP